MWTIVDSRTNKPVTVATFFDKARAEWAIEEWKKRSITGVRRDVDAMLPYLEVKELDARTQ